MLQRLIGEWRTVAPYLLGDYYPLTGYGATLDTWMAWQFDRPDLGGGIVQVFRGEDSPYEVARFRLRGLAPDATVQVTNLDGGEVVRYSARELLDGGVRVEMKDRPGALVLRYVVVGSQ
jgi:alpha-galactosidase